MYRLNFLLLGFVCVTGAAFAFLRSLTGPQFIPPAEGRSTVRTSALPAETLPEPSSPTGPLSPLDEYRATLLHAEEYLNSVDSYTATFIRQVRKDDELLDLEEISIKVRHQPLSLYMNWDKGQQVLYVEGENDGRLLAKRSTGLFRRTLRLGPTSRLAMADSRYPIYELGMLNLAVRVQAELAACTSFSGVDCIAETVDLDGQSVRQFTLTFDSPLIQETYSHCVICFTEGDPMPVCITAHGWDENGEAGGLLEHYSYRDVRINPGLTDLDFDPENEAYGF